MSELPVTRPVPQKPLSSRTQRGICGCSSSHSIHHIPQNSQAVGTAGLRQGFFKPVARRRCGKVRLSPVTTERDEVQVPRLLIPVDAGRHFDSFTQQHATVYDG